MSKRTPIDEGYKLVFSEAVIIEALIKRLFSEEWVTQLDFKTLEKVNSSFISEKLRKRESDLIWKLQWLNGEWLYLLIIFEFQSNVYKYMGLRILTYTGLLLEDLIKSDAKLRKSGHLPPILPIVIYTGEAPWTAPLSLADFYPDYLPTKLKAYQPKLQYWLLDEARCKINFEGCNEVLLPLLATKSAQNPEEIKAAMDYLFRLLSNTPGIDSLKRACTIFCAHVLKIEEKIPNFDVSNLNEAHKMVSDRLERMMEEYGRRIGAEAAVKARLEGELEGKLEGKLEGERKLVLRLIAKKFGRPSPAQTKIISSLSEAQISDLFDRLLDAKTLEEALLDKKSH